MAASLLAESIVWYTIASVAFWTRILYHFLRGAKVCTRVNTSSYNFGRGLRRMPLVDGLMALAFAFYSAELVTMNITASLQSNLLPPGYLDHHTMDAQEIEDRTFGSKMTLVVEQCQISTIWLVKACLLWMWSDITHLACRQRNRIVTILGGYVILGWVLMEAFYFGLWCRPFSNYWAVPTPNPEQCAADINHLITNAVLNISSDCFLLVLSVSIAWKRTFTGMRKLGFWILCGLGVFIILCAVLNKVYSFTNPFGSDWSFWYIRECSTAVILSNFAFAWRPFVLVASAIYTRFLKLLGINRPDPTTSMRSHLDGGCHETVLPTKVLPSITGVNAMGGDLSRTSSTPDSAEQVSSSSSLKPPYEALTSPCKAYMPSRVNASRLATGRLEADVFSEYRGTFHRDEEAGFELKEEYSVAHKE